MGVNKTVSVTLRPDEKVQKFENQIFVHSLVSMGSSMFKFYAKKITNVQNWKLI